MKTIKETRTVLAVKMFIKSLRYIMAVKEGRLEIGPCSHKFPGMGSNLNSSNCSYFLFLWNILFACLYSQMQKLLLSCQSASFFNLRNINPWVFSVEEPPVNVEVKSSADLGTAVLGELTGTHGWGLLVHLRDEKCCSGVRYETGITEGAGAGWNGHDMMGGNVRLSSAGGISPSHCEHPGLFFLLLPCSPPLALGWPFGSLNFALHVADTSPSTSGV